MIARYPVKLSPVVFNQTHVIDDDIVDFPTFSAKLHFVTDKQVFGAVGNDPRIDLSVVRRVKLTGVQNP
jgi:hypothetical protein